MSSKEIKLCKVKDYVPIEELEIHPENPRQISKERLDDLKRSIIEKGFYEPILAWKKNGYILSGNHRFMAVKDLVAEGYKFNSPDGEGHVLPVVIVNVSDEKARAILFETNNHYADWVEEKLSQALKQARDSGQDTTAYGFTTEYVDVLLKSALTDAENLAYTPPIDGEEYDGDADDIGDREEFDSLILSKPVYEMTTALLTEIAQGMNKRWKPGDSYSEAAQILCQFAREKGIEELWTKPKTILRKVFHSNPTVIIEDSPSKSSEKLIDSSASPTDTKTKKKKSVASTSSSRKQSKQSLNS